MATYLEDENHAVVGYINGNKIENLNHSTVLYIEGSSIKDEDHDTVAYLSGNRFEDDNHTTMGYIDGSRIENINHATIGYVNGYATDIQKAASGIWLLVTFINAHSNDNSVSSDSSSTSSSEQKSGGLAILGLILGFLFKNPIGNIILGILFIIFSLFVMGGGNIGFYLREGGWGPVGLGIIITVVGVFRLIRKARR